jgi:uncharacterized delta-60 repeat protein
MRPNTSILCSLALLLSTSVSQAQSGTLDTNFGDEGVMSTGVVAASEYGRSLALQSDGSIIMAGYTRGGGDSTAWLMRYLPDGVIDDSFGLNGVRVLDISEGDDRALDVFVNGQNEIFVTGATRVDGVLQLFIGKLHPSGELDTDYGVNGFVVLSSLTGGAGRVVRQFPNGKVVAAGTISGAPGMVLTSPDGLAPTIRLGFGTVPHMDQVLRDMSLVSSNDLVYVGDGALDSRQILVYKRDTILTTVDSFGTNGIVVLDPSLRDERGTSVAVDMAGRILVGGNATDSTGSDILLIRLMPDGSLDNSFGTNGVVMDDFGIGGPEVQHVLVQPDGRIVVLVYKMTLGPTPIHLFRFLENGDLDPGFGDNGHGTVSIAPNRFETRSMLVVDSCQVLVTGTVGYSVDYDAMITAVQLADCSELPTAISAEEAEHDGLRCFPNPTTGAFSLLLPVPENATTYLMKILDMTGKVVDTRTVRGGTSTFDLNVPQGIYVVEVYGGASVMRVKLMVTG